MESLTAYYEALLAESGESLDSLGETDYYAEYDIAVQQAQSLSGDGPVYARRGSSTAIRAGTGTIFRRSCCTSRSSSTRETPALLEELSDVFGMTLPQA